MGGSNCIEGFCLCPAGQAPSNNGRCEKFTTTRQTTLPSTTQGTTPPPPTTSVFTSAFTIADLLSTRRQPAFIEIPTHAPLTTTVIEQAQDDECTAIGLICKGNTVCRNKSCQCPDGYVLHHDGCVSPEEAARRKARGKARHEGLTFEWFSFSSQTSSFSFFFRPFIIARSLTCLQVFCSVPPKSPTKSKCAR